MEQVKLLSTTVILTVLIWWSADSLVNEAVSVNVTFEAVAEAAATDMLVEVDAPSKPFEMQISGPRRIVEDVLGQAPLHARLRVSDRNTGPAMIRLDRDMLKREMAEQWNEFRELTIVSVNPDSLPVTIDHWIKRDVNIVLKRLGLAYDVQPQPKPTFTTVRMRESRLQDLPEGQPLQIDVSGELERLLEEQPAGHSVTVTIPVTPDQRIFGRDARVMPGAVEVTATVKAQRGTASISTVPILVAVSFANLGKPYQAVTRDGTPLSLVTQTITVTGPADEVTRLTRGATRVYGIIHLKEDDLEQLDVLKLMTPEYHLPAGVNLAEAPPAIEFRLINTNFTETRN